MKLLNKTIRPYLVYSFSILLITIPLFYFVIRSVLLHAVDKSLKNQMHDIRANVSNIHSQSDLEAWSRLDKDIQLSVTAVNSPDKIYTVYKFNERHNEEEPYREISGTISVDGALYKLVINISLVENEDLLGSIVLVETILLILLMGGMVWINRSSSKKIWQPFYTALNNIQEYEVNKNTSAPFKKTDIDEFTELNKAISNLFNRSSETYLQQKEFTENASHELQTPLAIFQSKLELLMQTMPLTEEQAMLIQDMQNANHRLARLNKSLLLLSKIENNQFTSEEDVNVTALTAKTVQQLINGVKSKNIEIEESYHDQLIVKANRDLIEILIINLLVNAIRYNIENGKVVVLVDKKILSVKNTGGLAPLNEKVFERFYKGETSTANTDSTGLGLAIAKNICRLFNFTITYNFENNMHVFAVNFNQKNT